MNKRFFLSAAAIFVAAVILCGCTQQETFPKNISLSSGEYPADTEYLTAVISDGETSLLDGFTSLKSADLSGSSNYEEILIWANAHPKIDVQYTVALNDSLSVSNVSESLDLSNLSDGELSEDLFSLLHYLPNLKKLDFGIRTFPLPLIGLISSSCPDLQLSCTFRVDDLTFSLADKKLNLIGISHSDADDLLPFLPLLNNLKQVDLGSGADLCEDDPLTWDDIALMEQNCPQAEFQYSFVLYEKNFTLSDSEMDLNHIKIKDNGEMVRKVISCMPNLTYLDMDFCGVSDEDMASIRDDFPNVKVVWRVWFGEYYTCRTDTEKILASCPGIGGDLTVENTQSLKYCTDVKYLDVGHNEILKDISFISYMPNLEVAILAMTHFTDTSPLADCPHLEYLEIQTNEITDLSPLSNLHELKHLNICDNFDLVDISPLYSLTQLERLWIGCRMQVPASQIAEMQRCAPDCVINTLAYDPHSEWRYGNARYDLLVQQFGYDSLDYTVPWKDPKYLAEGETWG